MSPFLTDTRFPQINEIDAYWATLCQGRSVPMRQDFRPIGVESALSETFLMELHGDRPARIRLAGKQLHALMGMDVRGMPLTSLFDVSERRRLERLIQEVCAAPAKIELSLSAERGADRPILDARMKLWPMADELGAITRILGGLSCQGEMGQTPRRFHICASQVMPIATPSVAKVGGEPMANFDHLTCTPTKAPYLRLVQTGAE